MTEPETALPHNAAAPAVSAYGFGLMRGDLELPPHAFEMLRVLYGVYLGHVLAKMRAWKDGGSPMSSSDLPDLDALAADEARDGIVHSHVSAAVDAGGRVLFVQRRADHPFHPGRWELPVARQEHRDANALVTLGRALSDSTGLEVDEATGYLDYFDFIADDGSPARQHVFVVTVTDLEALTVTGDYEHHRWELANGTTEAVDDSVTAIIQHALAVEAASRPTELPESEIPESGT